MSPELIGILAVGVALATLLIGLAQWLRADIGQTRADIGQARADIGQLAARVSEHGERLARIEGLLEGLGLRRGDSLVPGD